MDIQSNTEEMEAQGPYENVLSKLMPQGESIEGSFGGDEDDDGLGWDEDEEEKKDEPKGVEKEKEEKEEEGKDEDGDEDGEEDDGEDDSDSSKDIEGDNILDYLVPEFGEVELEEDEFDDELSAVKAYIKSRDKKVQAEVEEKTLNTLFERFPEAEQLVQHLHSGYTIETFMKSKLPTYKEVDLEKATEDQKIEVIRKGLQEKGLDEDDIEAQIEVYRDTDKVDAKAEANQNYLKKKNQEAIDSEKAKEKAAADAAAEKAKEVKERVESLLEEGKIGHLTLDNKGKEKFKDFLFGLDEEGNSVRNKAYKDLSPEQHLVIDYLIHTNFAGLNVKEEKKQLAKTRNIKIKERNTKTDKVKLDSSAPALKGDLRDFFKSNY